MRLSVLAGVAVGMMLGAALTLACTVKPQQRNANSAAEPTADEAEVSGEAPESAAAATSSPSMH